MKHIFIIVFLLTSSQLFALGSKPARKYLWILNREPVMDPILYQSIIADLEARGWNMSRLEKTSQQNLIAAQE